jgi:hypothetical protein
MVWRIMPILETDRLNGGNGIDKAVYVVEFAEKAVETWPLKVEFGTKNTKTTSR